MIGVDRKGRRHLVAPPDKPGPARGICGCRLVGLAPERSEFTRLGCPQCERHRQKVIAGPRVLP